MLYLGSADVAGGLVATDVLFPGLHRHAERGPAGGVDANSDDTAGHEALVLLRRGEERGVRAAVSHGHAEALRGADGDVGADLAGRAQRGEREQVGGHDDLDAVGVRVPDELGVVEHLALRAGVLHEHAADVAAAVVQVLGVGDDDPDAEAVGAGAAHVDGLRVAVGGDEEGPLLAPEDGAAHGHGLGGGGGLVEEGGVGHGEAGEVGDHGLVVEQRLEAALRDLGLVRGVLGVPGRVLHEVAQHHRGDVGAVVAHPDEGLEVPVHGRQAPHVVQHLRLGEPGVEPAGEPHRRRADGGRDRGVDQRVDAAEAARGRHGLLLGGRRGVVPPREGVARLQRRHRHRPRLRVLVRAAGWRAAAALLLPRGWRRRRQGGDAAGRRGRGRGGRGRGRREQAAQQRAAGVAACALHLVGGGGGGGGGWWGWVVRREARRGRRTGMGSGESRPGVGEDSASVTAEKSGVPGPGAWLSDRFGWLVMHHPVRRRGRR
jgi:hypothetical protein